MSAQDSVSAHLAHSDSFFRPGTATSINEGDYRITWRTLWIAVLAIGVGIIAAFMSWVLQMLIGLVTNLLWYQRWSTDLISPGFESHPWWLYLLLPVVGGLIIGLMARYGSEGIRGHGMPETMQAILVKRSVVQPRLAILKPLSAAISIGSGGPFGAEGPIIMTGGAVGSSLGQLLKVTANERKTLLVAGGAAGMAATFNTSVAAVLLAVELLLFEFRARSLVPVSIAVATATIVRGPLLGYGPKLPYTQDLNLDLTANLGAVLIALGGVAIAAASVFLIYHSDDLFHKLPIHWMWWPALGGLIIGIGGLIQPRALGVGYDVLGELLNGENTAAFILSLLVVKLLIWALSLGSGTSGSVLAPTFLIGGAMGAAIGLLLPDVAPGYWALLGIAAVCGGSLRAPLTGVVFTLELTHAWDAMVPLLIASMTAYGISAVVIRRSILTEQLVRRGLHVSMDYVVDPIATASVAQIMRPLAKPHTLHDASNTIFGLPRIPLTMSVADALEVFIKTKADKAWVMAADSQEIIGSITLQEIVALRQQSLEEDRLRVRNLSPMRWRQASQAATEDARVAAQDSQHRQHLRHLHEKGHYPNIRAQ